MGAIEAVSLFIAKYVLPLCFGVCAYLYRELKTENKDMQNKLEVLKDKVSALDSNKISYEQCMALLDKQEQRIVDRLNSMESKIDKLFDRITNR